MKYIELTQGKRAIVDDADYDWLMQWKWHAAKGRSTWYASRFVVKSEGKRTTLAMHRHILSAKKGQWTDHRNHDGLDNQRMNIRLCTPAENNRNRKKKTGCTSKYKGVSWCTRQGCWLVVIRHKGNDTFLGSFSVEEDAGRAYNKAATEFFGEFAWLNQIKTSCKENNHVGQN